MQRRTFLAQSSIIAAGVLAGCAPGSRPPTGGAEQDCGSYVVNDMQSQLNPTTVCSIESPESSSDVADIVRSARRRGKRLSVCGGRHAMGGQQFGTQSVLVDTANLNKVLELDRSKGLLRIQAGAKWPQIIRHLLDAQTAATGDWTIREKQTGVDEVALGGTIGANAHGRGLTFPPMICDIESLVIAAADGELKQCSRTENRELFCLAFGGYGLLGVISEVTLRLVRRQKLMRRVEIIPIAQLMQKLEERLKAGAIYGDCQYAIDIGRDVESYPGILSTYSPVPDDTPITAQPKFLSKEDWLSLYALTRRDKHAAFEVYSRHYLSTNGQIYYSDLHQLSGPFFGAYREAVAGLRATEMLTEVYVQPDSLQDFLKDARKTLLAAGADVTYGTIRFIEEDKESFLRYAKHRSVCITCNLNVEHSSEGIAKAKLQFQALIDCVIRHGGSYYLTYHRWARKDQLLHCYPQMPEFIKMKRSYDRDEMFNSDWYRHNLKLLGV